MTKTMMPGAGDDSTRNHEIESLNELWHMPVSEERMIADAPLIGTRILRADVFGNYSYPAPFEAPQFHHPRLHPFQNN